MNALSMLRQFWEDRNDSERRTLTLAAIILAPTLAYFGLWETSHHAVEKLQPQIKQLQQQNAELQQVLNEITPLLHHPKPASLDLPSLLKTIEKTTLQAGIRNQISTLEIQPPNEVRITSDQINFSQWLELLRNLQRDQQIRVTSITIKPTSQTGWVSLKATLSNGSGE